MGCGSHHRSAGRHIGGIWQAEASPRGPRRRVYTTDRHRGAMAAFGEASKVQPTTRLQLWSPLDPEGDIRRALRYSGRGNKGILTMWFAKPLLAAFALGSMVALPAHAELDVASLKQSIESSFESEYPKLDALYKDILAHPEIAFQEEKTAEKLAAEMRAIGFEVTEKVGKTGLVALYKNGDGPTIMVRTELDALPMEEKTGLP